MKEKRTINGREVEIIAAGSIREEKEYIKTLSCPSCGERYSYTGQSLFPEEKLDCLTIECRGCKAERELFFDISSFFGT